jgi:hypothetical protein
MSVKVGIVAIATTGATGRYADNFSWSKMKGDTPSLIIENKAAPGFRITIEGLETENWNIQSIKGRCLENDNEIITDIMVVRNKKLLRFDSGQHPEFWLEIYLA